MITTLTWLGQNVTVPLWAFVIVLLLPVSYIARLSKRLLDKRFGNGSEKP